MRLPLTLLVAGSLLAGCASDVPDDVAPQDDVTGVDTVLAPCPEQGGEVTGGTALPAIRFDCLGGGTLDLARAPGVPTVVNLWASWCTPCREELPLLQEFADATGDRVRVVGVISRDGVPQAASFAADAGVSFPGAFDGEGELMAELGLPGLPATYLLDADGALMHTEVGPLESVVEIHELVAEHLGVEP
jgi:cytochrome c biogenesis protein CcmG, thiol:disulfide interchange protein DsbE